MGPLAAPAAVHVFLLLLVNCCSPVSGYKPVIMMHGVGSDQHEMDRVGKLIQAGHPGTVATSLPLYAGKVKALTPLKTQVSGVIAAIRKLVSANKALYADGYNFVCKSQGALICRCVIEAMDDHQVDTFVSLAGPQGGVYGSDFFAKGFKGIPAMQNLTSAEAYLVAYTRLLQNTVSVTNIWRDPYHLPQYYSSNKFLPVYNGLRASAAELVQFKHNFIRLKKAVFCVGSGTPYDGGIEPWQSGVWGAADPTGKILTMRQQEYYTNDLFGLQTLDKMGRLNLTIVPGAKHSDWTANAALINATIMPHLT